MNANRVEWSLLVDTMWRYQGRESSFGSAGWESWKATASHRFLLRQDTPLSWGWATKPCLTQIYGNYIDPLSLVSPGGFEYYSWRKPAAFGSWSVSIQRTTAGVQRYFLQNGWAVWKCLKYPSICFFSYFTQLLMFIGSSLNLQAYRPLVLKSPWPRYRPSQRGHNSLLGMVIPRYEGTKSVMWYSLWRKLWLVW